MGGFIKAHKRLLFIPLILIIILCLFGVYYLNSNGSFQNKSTVKSNLTGYKDFSEHLSSIPGKYPEVAGNSNFQKVITNINSLNNPGLTREEQYNKLLLSQQNLVDAYATTENHDLYNLRLELNSLIDKNFPEKIQKSSLSPICLDPSCADIPMSQEIAKLIDEINGLQDPRIPNEIKQNDIENLTRFSYLRKDWNQSRVTNYYFIAESIKNNSFYIDAGVNLKFYNEIIDYLKNTYPKEFEELQKSTLKNLLNPTVTQTK